MRIDPSKSNEEKLATVSDAKLSRQAKSISTTDLNLTTPATTSVEAWIMFGLLSSLVTQIGYVSRHIRLNDD